MIEAKNICKEFKTYHSNVVALNDINFQVREGEFVAIVGKSGCGKTTLLNIIAGLTQASKGTIEYNGEIIAGQKKDIDKYRREHIGIVLQNFSLLNDRDVYGNVELPLRIRKIAKNERNTLIQENLERLDMMSKVHMYPNQLSGGEKQRVVIARALVSNPDIILADEPTGALDELNSKQIISILRKITDSGKIVIMVTHNLGLISVCDRKIILVDGKISG